MKLMADCRGSWSLWERVSWLDHELKSPRYDDHPGWAYIGEKVKRREFEQLKRRLAAYDLGWKEAEEGISRGQGVFEWVTRR